MEDNFPVETRAKRAQTTADGFSHGFNYMGGQILPATSLMTLR
jgi:hypothetical protein